MAETLWRCSNCSKWSHAKRRPSEHRRWVPAAQVPEGTPTRDWTESYENDTGSFISTGAYIVCGPFNEWRAEQIAPASKETPSD